MPTAAPRPCNKHGCAAYASVRGYCEQHQKARWTRDENRDSANHRGYDARWQAARVNYLRRHPLCRECARHNRVTTATVVDHVQPHRRDERRFWDEQNWQSLCARCHNQKTQRGL